MQAGAEATLSTVLLCPARRTTVCGVQGEAKAQTDGEDVEVSAEIDA